MLRAAIISLALVVIGPLATRFGWVRFPLGLGMVALGSIVAVTVVALVVVASLRDGAGNWSALLLAVAALAVPLFQLVSAGRPPAIHDITTDTADPPMFQALLSLRGESVSPPDYDGPDAAAEQRRAYPDIVPLALGMAPAEALTRADRVARDLGWTVVATDPALGRLEATASTFWFRFTDDVVVRIRADAGGSRLDIRSKSRVGRGDLGANARRIRMFLAAMQRVG